MADGGRFPVEVMRKVEQEFRDEARIGDVRHDLITPAGRLTAGWSAGFLRANSPPDALDPQEWEEYPDGSSCCRYAGDPCRVRRFRRLAAEAFALLSRVECPEGGRVRLPRRDGHLGWVEAVYATARCYATADLRADFGWWNRSGAITLREDDQWASDPDGATYPLHPAYERLTAGLFRASAEAIRLWFDPDHAPRVGECVQDTPVCFTRAGDRPELTRPAPRWDGATLWCGGVAIRRVQRKAENVRRLLDAFQEAGWATRIDDPLPRTAGIPQAERLDDALRELNRRIVPTLIRFRRDGTGAGVRWEWVADDPPRPA